MKYRKSTIEKRKEVVKNIRVVWDALDSHLDLAIEPQHKKKCCQESVGLPSFHAKTTKEYAELLLILSKIL